MADWIFRPNRHGNNLVIRAANATGKSEEVVLWDESTDLTPERERFLLQYAVRHSSVRLGGRRRGGTMARSFPWLQATTQRGKQPCDGCGKTGEDVGCYAQSFDDPPIYQCSECLDPTGQTIALGGGGG